MEVVQCVPQLGTALWILKAMYDQHVENGNEIKELQSFIQDYDHHIPLLRERFQEGGGNVVGIAAFKNLEKDVMEATSKLERWSRNKSFFRVFTSAERMKKLGKLHSKVMASVQKSLGIANLSMLLDLQAIQATILKSNTTILESNVELKSLLITSIGSMRGTLCAEVRDEVVEASTSSFGDPKFWEDILAVVDNHNGRFPSIEEMNMFEDPITTNLMIDPIVASDGNTYCRWTIINNNMTTNPFNVNEDLSIVVDNLTFRRSLFEKFPEQSQLFRERRNQYRCHALSLQAKGLLGDAVLALQYVLQWDKHDVQCLEALEQIQGYLREAKKKYLQPSMGFSNEQGIDRPTKSKMVEMVVKPEMVVELGVVAEPVAPEFTSRSRRGVVATPVASEFASWSRPGVVDAPLPSEFASHSRPGAVDAPLPSKFASRSRPGAVDAPLPSKFASRSRPGAVDAPLPSKFASRSRPGAVDAPLPSKFASRSRPGAVDAPLPSEFASRSRPSPVDAPLPSKFASRSRPSAIPAVAAPLKPTIISTISSLNQIGAAAVPVISGFTSLNRPVTVATQDIRSMVTKLFRVDR